VVDELPVELQLEAPQVSVVCDVKRHAVKDLVQSRLIVVLQGGVCGGGGGGGGACVSEDVAVTNISWHVNAQRVALATLDSAGWWGKSLLCVC